MLDKKLIQLNLELATADYIVHSIHAFTIHAMLLILSKGILYARNSRLVNDKLVLVEVVHVKYHLGTTYI